LAKANGKGYGTDDQFCDILCRLLSGDGDENTKEEGISHFSQLAFYKRHSYIYHEFRNSLNGLKHENYTYYPELIDNS
jgi:hypothetical protein